jgi:hypothetical protein
MFQMCGEARKRATAVEKEKVSAEVPQGCYGLTLHRYQFTIGIGSEGSVGSMSVQQSNLV